MNRENYSLKDTELSKILIGVFILLLLVSVVFFRSNLKQVVAPRNAIYDKTYVGALRELSDNVPENATLVSSHNEPYIEYFTGHDSASLYGVSSKEELVGYMIKRNYTYLVVFEGRVRVDELKLLFSPRGLKNLTSDFEEISNYTTDYSKIHLYQLKSSN